MFYIKLFYLNSDEINFDLEKRIQNFVAAKRNLLFSNEDSNRNETQSEKDVIMISSMILLFFNSAFYYISISIRSI